MSPPRRRAANQAASPRPRRRQGPLVGGLRRDPVSLRRGARRLFMLLGVMFRRFVPVMGRMQFMRMRHVGVMARLLVIARFIVLGRFTMMVRGSLMMLGRELVVGSTLVRLRAHVALLSLWSLEGGETATSI